MKEKDRFVKNKKGEGERRGGQGKRDQGKEGKEKMGKEGKVSKGKTQVIIFGWRWENPV